MRQAADQIIPRLARNVGPISAKSRDLGLGLGLAHFLLSTLFETEESYECFTNDT